MKIFLLNMALAVISLFFSAYLLQLVKKNSVFTVFNRHMRGMVENSKEKVLLRAKREEQLRMEDGLQEKDHFFYKMDLKLIQSGLTKKIPFLTTEIFFILVIGSMAVAFIAAIRFSFLIAVIVSAIVGLFYYVLLFILCNVNYKKTEQQIITFVGLLKNYAKTSDDIISIMQSVAVYLEEPLKTAVTECCMEAKTKGDISNALMKMGLKIQHKEFQKLVTNLEMCSRYKANYGEIISRSMSQLRNYLAAKEEQKKMAGSARMTILMILAIGICCFWMLNGFVEEGVLLLLQKTFVGKCILMYLFFILVWSLWKFISIGNRE